MNLIIRKATIYDASSPHHLEPADILVSDGRIARIGKSLRNTGDCDELKLEGLCVSPGWFDSSVCLGEPGFEERETIAHGLEVAATGGFTAIALQPNNHPVTDNQSQVQFAIGKARNSAVDLYPIGALTQKSEGTDLAELFDMKKAGAVAFGDYNKNMENANLLKIALQYTQDFDALLIAFSQDSSLKGNGVANEGVSSTRLGLKGIPNLAEELAIARNLYLLEYAGGRLHIPTVSTARSVQLIKEAKAKGLNVSCSVAVHHLVLNDEVLGTFDTRFKTTPPLRSEADRKALLKGVKDGVIDMITSDHNPIDIEHKKMEFDLATNGSIGLESAFTALLTVLPAATIVEKLTAGRKVFGLPEISIAEGAAANLSLFSTEGNSVFSKEQIKSKSKNSALLGTKTSGKVYGIINNGKLVRA